MFIAALFTITKRQKQLKSPSTNEWITQIYYNAVLFSLRKEYNFDTCYNMEEA